MQHIKYWLLRTSSLNNTAAIVSFLAFAASVHAQGASLPGVNISGNNGVMTFITDVVCQIAVWMFWILIALSVVFVMWAAYNYLLSRGEEERIRVATRTITYAAVAIVVALLAKGFPLIVITLFPSVTGISTGSTICP